MCKVCVKAWLVFSDETTSPWAAKVAARTFVFGFLRFQNHQGLTWLPISHHRIYDLVFVQKKQSVLTFTCTSQLTGLCLHITIIPVISSSKQRVSAPSHFHLQVQEPLNNTLQGRRMGWGTEDCDIWCSLGHPGHQTTPCYFLVVSVWILCSHCQLESWNSDVSYQSHTRKSRGGGRGGGEGEGISNLRLTIWLMWQKSGVFSASSTLLQILYRQVYISTTVVPKFNFSNCSVYC